MPSFVPDLSPEITYRAVRSGGKGGQSVNKVASKVELRFDVENSTILTHFQQGKINRYLQNRLNREGVLVMTSDSERTQLANKRVVTLRFYRLLETALRPQKRRVATKPSRASKENRLKSKKIHSQKKQSRQKGNWD